MADTADSARGAIRRPGGRTARSAGSDSGGSTGIGPGVAPLLIGQGVSLGFTLANLIVPGSAVFLSAFGSGRLPYVYLIIAGAGSLVSAVVNRLQSRFGLHHLSVGATLMVAGLSVLSWRLLAPGDQRWVGYLVLTLFAVHLQMGFVFIGAQAGRAFDVQGIKRVFPRIVSGFVFGFMVGGFLADPLQRLFGRTEHLLAVAACGALVMAVLLRRTASEMGVAADESSVNGTETAAADGIDAADDRPPPLRALLGIPLVAAVFGYQVLSAMATQLVDYLVYDRAAVRYVGTEELASFTGGFTAILNFTELIVLALLGSLLMARYGLRFGVGANPVVVTGLLVLAVVASAAFGTESTMLFVLIGLARISDITLADLATRTSVNATFQVLPPNQRLAAQVGVEGVGVPVALGLTAALVLTINAVFDSPTTPMLVATMIVCAAWCWFSVVVFGRYRTGTVVAARRRMLDDATVDLAEPATRAALIELAGSDDAADVRAAVDLLAGDGSDQDETLDGLLRTAANREVTVGHGVLPHLVVRDPALAADVAARCVRDGRPELVVDGIRAFGRLGGSIADQHLAAAVDAEDTDVRAAALAATIGLAGRHGAAGESLAALVRSTNPEDRLLAARVLRELGSAEDAASVALLLTDRDRRVGAAAGEVVAALPDDGMNTVFRALATGEDRSAVLTFLRTGAGAAGPSTCASVAAWMVEADPRPANRAIRFLVASGYRLDPDDPILDALIGALTDRAATAARWSADLEGSDRTDRQEELHRLRRALDAERALAQRQLIDALALCYDRTLAGRVRHLWSDLMDGDHAMAREALDLNLDGRHRVAVLDALVDMPLSQSATYSEATAVLLARTVDWAAEPDWLQACAVTLVPGAADAPLADALVVAGPITEEILTAAERGTGNGDFSDPPDPDAP
ncbi:MAG: hypothetical protein AAGA65_20170 [Actinomycetota bacterium]